MHLVGDLFEFELIYDPYIMLSFYVFPAKSANPSKVVTLRAKVVNMQATKAYGTMVALIH